VARRLSAIFAIAALAVAAFATAASAEAPLPDPKLGPVPDLAPVPGQYATPGVLRDCQDAGVPRTQVPGVDPRAVGVGTPNPLAGLRFFADPSEHAFGSYRRYVRQGRLQDASLMWKIASTPRFRWWGRWTRPNMHKKVQDYLRCVAALQPGTVPLMTVMRHQGKTCKKGYTAGGEREDRRTRKWYDRFADAVGNARVVIAFEPDSLGTIDCLTANRRYSRLNNLRYGVDVLSKLPNATIYLEGGAADWEPAGRTARFLRYIGIGKVRGFMLNTTHYEWTGRNIEYGLKVSRYTGGKHFIISTAFNGRGGVHYRRWISHHPRKWRVINVWCHPMKRGLGPPPTTATSRPDKVDAYLWIGRPGYSGGSCNGGPLPVGSWWPDRALMFAENATDWLGPPGGTKAGHFKRYSLKRLGG
jgi:endoglucanase